VWAGVPFVLMHWVHITEVCVLCRGRRGGKDEKRTIIETSFGSQQGKANERSGSLAGGRQKSKHQVQGSSIQRQAEYFEEKEKGE